jgi:hypothetical protein
MGLAPGIFKRSPAEIARGLFLEPSSLPAQRAHGLLRGAERAVHAPGLDVVETLGEPLVDEGAVNDHLRSEGDLVPLNLGLENVADGDARFVAHLAGKGDPPRSWASP